jgi:hypothetical protein
MPRRTSRRIFTDDKGSGSASTLVSNSNDGGGYAGSAHSVWHKCSPLIDWTMELARFSSKLRDLLGNAESVRPLLCTGSPTDCEVALVGANPGTTTPFWPYWSDSHGMDKDGWLCAYREQHGGKYGRSRAAIERFVPLVHGRVIELNAHVKQSARINQLTTEHRTTIILDYILGVVRPRVAICAGTDAARAVAEIRHAWPMTVINAPHFIYWGRERERELANEVNAVLQGT